MANEGFKRKLTAILSVRMPSDTVDLCGWEGEEATVRSIASHIF